jgi:heme-degrading monooxygenase HmoA
MVYTELVMPPIHFIKATNMYAVIFKATIADLDDEYLEMAERLRDLAFNKYGCFDFVSVTEGNEEIAVSYWKSKQQILDWRNDPQHRLAKNRGREKWYKSCSVEICEIVNL